MHGQQNIKICQALFSLHKDTTPPQPNHTVTPTHIEPQQYNTWNKSTVSRKLLKMDVLTFETCWVVNGEIIKRVTSSWSIFIQLTRKYFFIKRFRQRLAVFEGSLASPACPRYKDTIKVQMSMDHWWCVACHWQGEAAAGTDRHTCVTATLCTTNATWTVDRPETNRLSQGTAYWRTSTQTTDINSDPRYHKHNLPDYKDSLVSVIYGNNRCLWREWYKT